MWNRETEDEPNKMPNSVNGNIGADIYETRSNGEHKKHRMIGIVGQMKEKVASGRTPNLPHWSKIDLIVIFGPNSIGYVLMLMGQAKIIKKNEQIQTESHHLWLRKWPL